MLCCNKENKCFVLQYSRSVLAGPTTRCATTITTRALGGHVVTTPEHSGPTYPYGTRRCAHLCVPRATVHVASSKSGDYDHDVVVRGACSLLDSAATKSMPGSKTTCMYLDASDVQTMAHMSPKNFCFFKSQAEATLVGFVDRPVCADSPFRGECIDGNLTVTSRYGSD
jgi:hypothetical protein